MCGFMVSEEKLETLKRWRVRDSKLLSPRRREYLYKFLVKLADDYVPLTRSAMDIDKLRTETNLNKMEIKMMQDIINNLNPDKAIIDAVEANTKAFRAKIIGGLRKELKERLKAGTFELVCENKADVNYPVVGAASIIAKVIRDSEVAKLHQKYGDFGSGYPSDILTVKWLKSWLESRGSFPPEVRHSWITAKELLKEKAKITLGQFAKPHPHEG
jgi:ribonuclease HII